ncbi:MAG: ABC transporter substrate-binding protein [Candidatus Rokubacteria bacterium]|nr:ABC transporter substrate-binding protein [Candidatus Rokubacteria bacterium]
MAVVALAALCGAASWEGDHKREPVLIGLVTAPHAAYAEAESGLRAALLSGAPGVRVVTVNVEGTDGEERARSVLSGGADLIVGIGSRAAKLARRLAPRVPLVYAMVLDPAAAGLPAPGQGPSDHVTGVSMEVAPERQFELMREMLPSVRRIGVLYDPLVSGDSVRRAAAAARAGGLTLVGQAVRSEAEVLAAASLLAPAVDAFWALADPTVLTAANARALILLALRTRKPLFAVSEGFVRSGALAAVAANPREVGWRAGELAARILGGTPPAALRPEAPPGLSIFINRATAEVLGVKLSQASIDRAQRTFPQP